MQPRQSLATQCIFCSFHGGLRRAARPSIVHTQKVFATSGTRILKGPGAPSTNKGVKRLKGLGSASTNKPLGLSGPITLSPRVKDRLEVLKRKLENEQKQAASEEADDPSAPSIDPDGIYWDEFVKIAATASEPKEKDTWSPFARSLHDKLSKAHESPDWRDAMTTTLQWGYLDFALSGSKVDGISPLQNLVDLRYPTEWYGAARAQQRDIHLHVGPTNSGKTYNALKRLEESRRGFYAGPLRLLAHEVYTRFRAKGIACDMITGDDVRLDDNPDVQMTSSTVEMVNVNKEVDVAVIDEIQMMADEDRGWAWTRAFLGSNAKEVHLCGETRVVPLVKELAASMGDTLHLHRYERLNPLKAMSRSLGGNLKNLRKGDCIVSFSVVGIHALKSQIEAETGRRVAIVYGSLPPETRAQQAAFFNDPNSEYDYLVASDAVGMGLNLAIKRIIFESVMRFNGTFRERLSVPALRQIAGRAGRYRTAHDATTQSLAEPNRQQPKDRAGASKDSPDANIGLVTCIDDADLPFIQRALNQEPPPIKTAGILPPGDYVEDFAARLPKGLPFEYILQRVCDSATLHPRFKLCDIRDNLEIARVIDNVKGLTIADRYLFTAAPANNAHGDNVPLIQALAKCIANSKPVTVADLYEIPLEILEKPMSADRDYLKSLENLHKALILFLWLSYRFFSVLKDQDMAFHAKALAEEKINLILAQYSSTAKKELNSRLTRLKERTAGKRANPYKSMLLPKSGSHHLNLESMNEPPAAAMHG